MSEQIVKFEVDEQVAWITLNRPNARNAINRSMLSDIGACLAMLAGRVDVRAVIVRGEGKAFAAGADISEMSGYTPLEAEAFARLGQRVFTALERLPMPTIALVHGYAFGGGLELAMACDIRVATQGAAFGQPEVTLGVLPGFGGSARLPRIIGQGRALDMLLTGERISADAALSYGLVSKVVPEALLVETGKAYAERFRQLPATALASVKRAVYDGSELELTKAQSLEASLFGLAFATRDHTEGMTAFLEKRTPQFPNA